MTLTPSNMMPLGTKAPDFSLPDTISDNMITLQDNHGKKATVILFICNHCPFVKLINEKLVEVANHFQPQGIQFIAISANDVSEYPDDAPEKMKIVAAEQAYSFPYLYDETQSVAKAYDAACTPDIFVFDKNLSCVYRGRFDDATPGKNIPVTGKDLSAALDCIIAEKAINSRQIASQGCNIKWK